MIKRFCDFCGDEIERNSVRNRIQRELTADANRVLWVEVIVGHNQVWNDGDVCACCVMRAVVEGTDIRR